MRFPDGLNGDGAVRGAYAATPGLGVRLCLDESSTPDLFASETARLALERTGDEGGDNFGKRVAAADGEGSPALEESETVFANMEGLGAIGGGGPLPGLTLPLKDS